MKKITVLLLTLCLVMGLCSCTIRLSTTDIPKGNDAPPQVDPAADPVEDEELTLEAEMALKSTVELLSADVEGLGYIAPALDKNSGLWGYINLKSEWVISPKFRSAEPFSGDYACVRDAYGDHVFVDKSGEDIFAWNKAAMSLAAVSSFSEGLANATIDSGYTQQMCYLDTAGNYAVPLTSLPRASGVNYRTVKYVELATPFRNGKAVVMRYTNATLAAEGIGASDTAYVIDTAGNVIASLASGLDASIYGFDDNMRIVVKATNGLYGLADENGNMVAHAAYLRILHCEGGLYLACDQSGFWGVIDKDGNTIVEPMYNNALPYSEGYAAVSDGIHWGFIDEAGNIVIPIQYDDVAALKKAVNGNAESSGAFGSGVAVVRAGKYWGVIDKSGNILYAAEAQECPVSCISNGFMTFEYSEGCGVISTDGKLAIIPIYDGIGEFK